MSENSHKLIFSGIKLQGGEPSEKASQEFSNYYYEKDGEVEKMTSIDTLSKVNIFVGANNSGKSRFLRELSKIKYYLVHVRDLMNPELDTSKLFERNNRTDNTYRVDNQGHFSEMSTQISSREEQLYRDFLGSQTSKYSNLFQRTYIPINRGFIRFDLSRDAVYERQEGKDLFAGRTYPDFKLLYGEKDLFEQRTSRLYELQQGIDGYRIATGYDFYNEVKIMLLGDTNQRKTINDFQNFLKKYFYEDKEVLLIPNESARTLFIKIDNDEKEVYKLGDGIQNVIHILFEVFTRKNCLFFIEEPELTMHPGMQRRLLEILLSDDIEELKGANQQFFITTHSNHLLDLTLDYQNISVYKFSTISDNRKLVTRVSNGNKSLLEELGVQNSSVFLANKAIWVEGISDRKYIRTFLNLYIEKHHPKSAKPLIEDIDYVIAEYQGSNIKHWLFGDDNEDRPIEFERLCSDSLFIADKDGDNKKPQHARRQELLGEGRYLITPGREIENILSIKSIVDGIKGFSKSNDFTLLEEVKKYKVNNLYTLAKYKNKLIGDFIMSELKPTGNNFMDKSGTLMAGKKNDFSFYATENMTYEDMTIEAIEFTAQIYSFILNTKDKII